MIFDVLQEFVFPAEAGVNLNPYIFLEFQHSIPRGGGGEPNYKSVVRGLD